MRLVGNILLAFLLPVLPVLPAFAQAPSTSMDVAPTLVRLAPGEAGLVYVTNHGAAPLTVEMRAMDWRQDAGRDVLSPSSVFFTSPPVVTIAPGVRQSVRLLTEKPGAYRLLVSELPDPAADPGRVKVLLQFSVPVFAGDLGTPLVSFSASRNGAALVLSAVNRGLAPVKLSAPTLGGVILDRGPVYLLPGARRDFSVTGATSLHLTAHDVLSGRDFDADVAP
jgi:P pilus assembly chaperone PapD